MSRDASETYIYRKGSSPNTRVAISQKNRVYSKPYTRQSPALKQIGVLSTFDWTESRAIDPVRGVGFGDKIQELVPGVTEPMGLTLNRTLLYTSGIAQEVGYKGGVDGLVRSLRQHKWPFDLRSELVFSELVTNLDIAQILERQTSSENGDPNLCLLTFYEACWLESLGASFPSDSAIVVEDAAAKCTDCTDGTHMYGMSPDLYGDLLNSGNNPILVPGSGSNLFA
jgi:hypothetical protein